MVSRLFDVSIAEKKNVNNFQKFIEKVPYLSTHPLCPDTSSEAASENSRCSEKRTILDHFYLQIFFKYLHNVAEELLDESNPVGCPQLLSRTYSKTILLHKPQFEKTVIFN